MTDSQRIFPMSDYSKKRVLVYDGGGLFLPLAERLSRDFAEVGYFKPWQSDTPDGRELMVGYGVPRITRVKYFFKDYSNYDLIVFPDVWEGDLQEDLRNRGCRVWGSGMGSGLELNRAETKREMEKGDFDINPWSAVKGTQALRKYLKDHDGQYVKISTFRGLGETFEADNLDDADGMIAELESKHAALAPCIPFVCENKVESKREVGYDGYCIDGQFPDTAVFGIEKKNKAYFGIASKYSDMPPSVIQINDELSGLLNRYKYRQFLSTEIIEENGSENAFLIDLTCRQASPAGEVYCEILDNISEIIWEGAGGKLVQPDISKRYGAQIVLTSDWAVEHCQKVEFPEEIRDNVKLYNHCRIDGVDWVIPQTVKMKHIGSVVALSDSPEDARDQCKELASQIKGFDISYNEDALDEAFTEMAATAVND